VNIVFKVGPLHTHGGNEFAYFVYPGKEGKQVFFGSDDKASLAHLLASYSSDSLVCEPQLSEACAEFHIGTRELTPDEANHLGVMTFNFALPHVFSRGVKPASIYQLATSSAFFVKRSPWTTSLSGNTLVVAVTGSIKRRLQARILGGISGTPGLALYPNPEAVQQIITLFENHQMVRASNIDLLGITLEDGPDYAIAAMQRAYGLQKLPVPLKLEGGIHVSIDDLDILTLAAALRAVASLEPGSGEAHGEVGVDKWKVSVIVYL
jgi:hypothetical protein